MISGNLFIPTEIYCEENCVEKYGGLMGRYGRKALIVTGKHSSRVNGSFYDVTGALEKSGVEYVVYDDIEENPSTETVMKARNFGIDNNVDFVVGVGGGSPLDASKAIAMMIANPGKDADVLYVAEKLDAIPVVAVPTTAGTGSEVTPYSILTIHKMRTKQSISHRIFPVLALLDYRYIKTQSGDGIINTAVDTLAHLVESFLNTNSNECNRLYSKEGMRLFSEYKDALVQGVYSDEDFSRMMYASMLGGMSISHTGSSLPHGLSYMVTYETGEAHGRACGRYLGKYVKMYEEQDKKETEKVMELLGFASTDAFAEYLEGLLKLKELPEGMDEANWNAIKNNKAKLKNYPYADTLV